MSVFISHKYILCYTAVFSVVTQRSSPLTAVCGEERCVTTLITAAKETTISDNWVSKKAICVFLKLSLANEA